MITQVDTLIDKGIEGGIISKALGISKVEVEARGAESGGSGSVSVSKTAAANITAKEFSLLRARLFNLAMQRDDDRLAFEAAKFLFNEKLGRNEPKGTVVNNNNTVNNIQTINGQITAARERRIQELNEA